MSDAILKESIDGLTETVRNLYLADDIPWVIGYSGGKDSTATLQLIWLSIEQLPPSLRKKEIHIINTDTLVESPVVAKWVENSLEIMDKSARSKGLPFITHRLIPDFNNTFWVNLIGRGYPFPRMKYRWCTDRLKIQPVNNFIKKQIAKHGEIILVIGTRKAESARRARTMTFYEKKRVRELLSPNPTLANELVFSPLENWLDDDVWVFLMQYKNPWGLSNMELLTMYKGATADNECPLVTEKNMPSCGKSRFGCWVCTMVEKDKSMEAMIANDSEKLWMSSLLEFRNKFGNEQGDRERRSFRRMNGSLQGSYKQLFHGPYKKEIREEWLEDLLRIQQDIQNNGPTEYRNYQIIRQEELEAIRRIWVIEKHEFDDSLPEIYKKVIGKDFYDPTWISQESFQKEEWNILKETCLNLFPNEELIFEMMYTIIDIESKSNSMNSRAGIISVIESAIKKNFYSNEKDATNYYLKKMNRKKDLGGIYDEKFLMDYPEKNNLKVDGDVNEDEDVDI